MLKEIRDDHNGLASPRIMSIREINDRALGRIVQPNESANEFVPSADPFEEAERLEREVEHLRAQRLSRDLPHQRTQASSQASSGASEAVAGILARVRRIDLPLESRVVKLMIATKTISVITPAGTQAGV